MTRGPLILYVGRSLQRAALLDLMSVFDIDLTERNTFTIQDPDGVAEALRDMAFAAGADMTDPLAIPRMKEFRSLAFSLESLPILEPPDGKVLELTGSLAETNATIKLERPFVEDEDAFEEFEEFD